MCPALERAEVTDDLIRYYEGLVRKTAARYEPYLEEEFEDICQVFRVKVFRALLAFDRTRSSLARDNYVFGCLVNQAKDLLKKKKRNLLFIEDLAPRDDLTNGGVRDRFESQYLADDEVFAEIESDGVLIPSTLNLDERRVLVCLYLNYSQPEAAVRLGMQRNHVAIAVRTIREKMADWDPGAPSGQNVTQPVAQAA